MAVGAGEHRSGKNGGDGGDERAATTIDESRCEHCPRGRGHECGAESELDHRQVTAGARPSTAAVS
jgi:hypothetical protein